MAKKLKVPSDVALDEDENEIALPEDLPIEPPVKPPIEPPPATALPTPIPDRPLDYGKYAVVFHSADDVRVWLAIHSGFLDAVSAEAWAVAHVCPPYSYHVAGIEYAT